ncbi:hypothetical protein RFI_26512 [Reticulomyxa filosa]|uniref:Uncharacterized protein n=1 Tax=Reticulomyxa filosa TaxID=46433 RepID=X6MB64_RETFI|nr:hypothetical protein RFI_26512 [Reticulomyxa filosa]|eukprot:ETO10866.1 hypothetical protein RFI_26512 [Reticulomyxa filosa]
MVIGGHETIGKYIVKALKENDKTVETWIGGRPKKDKKSEERYVDVDIGDTKSVESFFSHVKEIDYLKKVKIKIKKYISIVAFEIFFYIFPKHFSQCQESYEKAMNKKRNTLD